MIGLGNGGMVCQRCFLNSMSNRTLLASTECGADNHRFISQKQYKRKLRKDCPSYATMERKGKNKKNGGTDNNSEGDANNTNGEDSKGPSGKCGHAANIINSRCMI